MLFTMIFDGLFYNDHKKPNIPEIKEQEESLTIVYCHGKMLEWETGPSIFYSLT